MARARTKLPQTFAFATNAFSLASKCAHRGDDFIAKCRRGDCSTAAVETWRAAYGGWCCMGALVVSCVRGTEPPVGTSQRSYQDDRHEAVRSSPRGQTTITGAPLSAPFPASGPYPPESTEREREQDAGPPSMHARDATNDATDTSTRPRESESRDVHLAAMVRRALSRERSLSLAARSATVEVVEGRAILTGHVMNETERLAVETLARRVDGVIHLDNRLVVTKSENTR